jgi:(p)ppGpp synthase/HD superfamily hydrolase
MSKQKIISIPSCASEYVLKTLQENNIKCEYLGIDQAQKILMQISYQDEQEKLYRELNTHIEEADKLLNEFKRTFMTVLKEGMKNKEEELKIKNFIHELYSFIGKINM